MKEEMLTGRQKRLIKYLSAIGCDMGTTFEILMNVWYEDALTEMIDFCLDNHPSNSEELLEASSEIYLKYKTEIDSVPECPEDEETEEYENTEADYPEEAEEDYQEDERPESTEPVYYLETADGGVMRVPKSRLTDFEAMNERRRAEKERNAASSQEDSSPEDKPKR